MTSHLRSTVVLLDTRTPGTSREIYSEDANDGTRTGNPSVINQVFLLAIELNSSKAIAGKELSLSSWYILSLYIYHFSVVVDFSSKKYSGCTGHGTPGTSSLLLRITDQQLQHHFSTNGECEKSKNENF